MDTFEKLLANIRKGISGTGATLGEQVERSGADSRTLLEPGDMVDTDAKGAILRQVAAPTGYDLWYLKHFKNLMEPTDAESFFIKADDLSEVLPFLSDDMGGVKPLKIITSLDDLQFDENYDDYFGSDVPWKSDGKYFVNLMAFETCLHGISEQLSSDGAPIKFGFVKNNVYGYLAFPVGQLGVMEVVSILRQSQIESDDFNLTDNLKPITTSTSDFFFPPADDYTGQNICIGDHLIESGYVVADNAKRSIEYPAALILDQYYPDVRPMGWMRYWIHGDEEKFIPGEFVGILVKPLALPPHPWWFQETSPLLYAGNWFETNNLTGGVITEIVEEADREDDGIGRLYTVKIHGREVKINASDFFEYEVDARVGIVKIEAVADEPVVISFMWQNQERIIESDVNTTFDPTEYQILPIDFYNNA